MKKFLWLSLVVGFVGSLAFATTSSASGGTPCITKKFETKLVKAACESGGQLAAKKEMKKFLKAAKAKHPDMTCKSCHSEMKPSYKLKKDGLKTFKKLGGK